MIMLYIQILCQKAVICDENTYVIHFDVKNHKGQWLHLFDNIHQVITHGNLKTRFPSSSLFIKILPWNISLPDTSHFPSKNQKLQEPCFYRRPATTFTTPWWKFMTDAKTTWITGKFCCQHLMVLLCRSISREELVAFPRYGWMASWVPENLVPFYPYFYCSLWC